MTDLSKAGQLARSPGGNRKCTLTGALKVSCSCPRCVGWRSQQKGRKAQRVVRKALHLKPERYASKESNEEAWTAALRLEVKSGKQVEAINRLYVAARNQSDASRSLGDVQERRCNRTVDLYERVPLLDDDPPGVRMASPLGWSVWMTYGETGAPLTVRRPEGTTFAATTDGAREWLDEVLP